MVRSFVIFVISLCFTIFRGFVSFVSFACGYHICHFYASVPYGFLLCVRMLRGLNLYDELTVADGVMGLFFFSFYVFRRF